MNHTFNLLKGYRPYLAILKTKKGIPSSFSESVVHDKGVLLMRLQEVKIKGWNTKWGRLVRKVPIYIITTVVDGSKENPIKLQLKSFNNVERGTILSIGNLGVSMYYKKGKLPEFLDTRILIVRSKDSYRYAGGLLHKINQNSEFLDAVKELSVLSGNPLAILSQVDSIIDIIAKILILQRDDQLLYYPVTISKEFEKFSPGKRCEQFRYVDFCYKIDTKFYS